ncbi:MAG TPA: TetR family transcriptional regulator [Pseudomonadales bacterium]|nr:TetR family transcriptional regulator [Pseudomonadales bacterium]
MKSPTAKNAKSARATPTAARTQRATDRRRATRQRPTNKTQRAKARPRANDDPRPPEDRRATILDATLRLIATDGVDAVTHRRVAAAAGVPLGSTTYYFESREQLLRESFRRYLEQIRALQNRVARTIPKTTVAGLVDYLVEMTQREFEDEQMVLAEYELTLFAARDPEIAEALHDWDASMLGHLARAFETMDAARPFDCARTVLNMMRGHELDSLSRHDSGAADLRRRLTVVVSALVGEADRD